METHAVTSAFTASESNSEGGVHHGTSVSTKAQRSREIKAAYRQRQWIRREELDEKVLQLLQRLVDLDMECVRYEGQCDALRHALASNQRTGAVTPPPQAEEISDAAAESLLEMMRVLQGSAVESVMIADCKHVTASFIAELYLDTILRYRLLLETGAGVPGSAQQPELQRLVTRATEMMTALWRTHGALMNKAMARYIKYSGGSMAPDPDLPLSVLAALHITREQQEQIVCAHRELVAKLEALYSAHVTSLSPFPSSRSASVASSFSADAAQPTLVQQILSEASAQLHDVLMAQANAVQDFIADFCLRILNPTQTAQAHAAAFPHILDLPAVAGCCQVAKSSSPAEGLASCAVEAKRRLADGMREQDDCLLHYPPLSDIAYSEGVIEPRWTF